VAAEQALESTVDEQAAAGLAARAASGFVLGVPERYTAVAQTGQGYPKRPCTAMPDGKAVTFSGD
jgi:hypothetical protein